jgi:DNA-directed RNA polymerase subunit M/transcription elongation factor TFIIS
MDQLSLKFVIPYELYNDKDYNNLRLGYLLLIADIIQKYLIDTNSILEYTNDIITIEKSCYLHALEDADKNIIIPSFDNESFEHLYRSKITRITKNMDIESEVNDCYLIEAIIYKQLDLSKISWLKSEELSPKHNELLLRRLNERMQKKITMKTTSLYRCKKCGSNSCCARSVQLRSLDEGQSISIFCTNCSHHWVIK